MRTIILFITSISLFLGCNTNPEETSEPDFFYMPEEYKEHDAIWLGWKDYAPYYQPMTDIIRALIDEVPLRVIANDSTSLHNLKDRLSSHEIDPQKIQFHIMKDNRLWMRDHGATYVINKKGDKKVVDFGWVLYGNEEYLKAQYEGNMDSVSYYYTKNLGQTGMVDSLMGALDNLPSIKTSVNMEGGSIEVNGKGTLILCEAVTMQRNPSKTKKFIEAEFRRVLGVSNIIWMKQGLAEDPFYFNQIFDNYFGWGTYGHTDEFVRFTNDSTILLAWVDEAEKDLNEFNRINYERMSENLAILENSQTQDGKAFKIIKVPLPDPIYISTTVTNQGAAWKDDRTKWQIPTSWFPQKGMMQEGDSINLVAASSYLNYLVTNGTLLLPSYLQEGSSPEKEEQVRSILAQVFPNKKLKFLDVTNLNFHGGGIHCVTQQEPKGNANISSN